VLIFAIFLLCMPAVFAVTANNCYMIATGNCAAGYTAVGHVSSDGHFTTDSTLNNFPYDLCCINYGINSGAVSFKYARDPSGSTGQGAVSVNSSVTNFAGSIKLGFQNSCYLKQTACDNSASEVCVFKVSNSSDSASKWKSVADSSHIADCSGAALPNANSYPNYVCCKLSEICTNGIDDDGDGFIDCADQDCNHYAAGTTPEFCTGSIYNSNTCVYVIRHDNGVPPPTTVYNINCTGEPPTNPPVNNMSFYCSYGRLNQYSSGLCCPQGKYAYYDNATGLWSCQTAAICGIENYKDCNYDFDSNKAQWLNSVYSPNSKWCQSKMPYLYSPQITPTMNTACCFIAQNGDVGYYTDAGNVKILGYQPVCGDGILDSQPPYNEQCDGSVPESVTCAGHPSNCPGGMVPTGTPTCSAGCQIVYTSCYCGNGNSNG